MQNLLKKLFFTISIIGAFFTTNITLWQNATYATPQIQDDNLQEEVEVPSTEKTESGTPTGENCRYFLGLPSWDCGINPNPSSEGELTKNATTIATNILAIISGLAVYFLIGYVIYGGYLYIFSSGDPNKSAAGKKTLTNAFLGLAIATCARIIFSSISIAITGNADLQQCALDSGCESGIIMNLINWFIGIAGFVSAAYVVVGGVGYITSSGDPVKLQKSQTTILYSLIGLTIVALSLSISGFVSDAIDASNNGDDIRGPILNLLNTVIGFASVVSVIYVIKGGVGYMTSTGDPTKLKKAKDTILYALIGLIICALSFALVNWAIGTIKDAEEKPSTAQITNTKIPLAFLEKKL